MRPLPSVGVCICMLEYLGLRSLKKKENVNISYQVRLVK
jgi:hypothetical protein